MTEHEIAMILFSRFMETHPTMGWSVLTGLLATFFAGFMLLIVEGIRPEQ